MIACAQWVPIWIEERVNPAVLIVFEQLPPCAAGLKYGHNKANATANDRCEIGPMHPGQKHDRAAAHDQQQ